MDADAKLDLLLRDPVTEVVTREELKALLEGSGKPRHYIGFEISGMLHLGSGLMTKLVLERLQRAGVETTIFLADFHSQINNKMGGDLDRIRAVAREYYIPAFREGLGLKETKFVLASDLYDRDYWALVLRIARQTTLARGLRTLTVLGRSESDLQSVAQLLYAPMQAADIFWLKADIAHAGIDQRKAHMLAREAAPGLGFAKPVALHHALLPGLLSMQRAGKSEEEMVEVKMSKSRPETCVFLHDPPETIRKKLAKAYCPAKEVEANPVLELARRVVLPAAGALEVHRESKHGGDARFGSFAELRDAFARGSLHPQDLKAGVAETLARLLEKPRKFIEARPGLLEPFREEP
ncbi:MAG: tyrosine--tRNA ligase [Halobacteria archaeon]